MILNGSWIAGRKQTVRGGKQFYGSMSLFHSLPVEGEDMDWTMCNVDTRDWVKFRLPRIPKDQGLSVCRTCWNKTMPKGRLHPLSRAS